MKNNILSAAALTFIAVACNQKTEQPLYYGELSVSLSGEPEIEVVSKAAQTLDPESADAANYTVRIFDSSDVMKYEAKYNVFKTQTLPLGTYYVTAENCSATEAESDNGQMRLYGRSSDITLSTDLLSQEAAVNCEVVNGKVTVVYDSSVSGRFTGLKVDLISGDRTVTVNETATDVETVIWFNPATVSYTISGTFDATSKPVNITKQVDVQAKSNIRLVVKVNLSNGQLVPNITFDTSIDDPTTEDGEFNPYE